MRHYRRNADSALRRAERRYQAGGVEEHAAYLNELLRAQVITPERIAMAAYLGNPAAQAMNVPPPPGPGTILWLYHSRANEILDRAPISTKHATLFACDVATRRLMFVADPEHEDAGLFLWAFRVVNTARSWVLGGGEDPEAAGAEFWMACRDVAYRMERPPESYAFECARNAAYMARRQPKDQARAVIQTAIWAAEQYASPRSKHEDHGHAEAADKEIAWQDNHLAMGLLSPSWPIVQGLP